MVVPSATGIWTVAFVIVMPPACVQAALVTRAALYWYPHEYAGLHGASWRSAGPGAVAQVAAGTPRPRRCWFARRDPPAHFRPAPRGSRAAGQPVRHVLHLSRAGTSGAAIGPGAGRSGGRAADLRRRTPLPPGARPRTRRRGRRQCGRGGATRADRSRRGRSGPAPRSVSDTRQRAPLGRAGRQSRRAGAVHRLGGAALR